MSAATTTTTLSILPSVLLVKVLQYVPLFDRLCNCAHLCRTLAVHVRHPTGFTSDLVQFPASQWARLDSPAQWRSLACRCSAFSLLERPLRFDEYSHPDSEPTQQGVLSFAHRLTRSPCSLIPSPLPPLRYVFLSGRYVDDFSLAARKWSGDQLANVQCVFMATSRHNKPRLSTQVVELLRSMPSLEVVHLGQYNVSSQQLMKLLSLPALRRLDLSTCHCTESISSNSNNLPLSQLLESLLLPSFTTWENPNANNPTKPTRRLVSAVTHHTATTLRHFRITGVFTHGGLAELCKLTALVSLDLTLYRTSDWTLLAALVGREEDGVTYVRLKHLRHLRLHVGLDRAAVAAMAEDCHVFVRTLRMFLSTHAEQLETVNTVTVPPAVADTVLFDRCLLPAMPRLRRLELHGLELGDMAQRVNRLLVWTHTPLPHVHTLVVSGLQLSDRAVMRLLAATPSLQHITFEQCNQLTVATLLALATFCPSLLSVFFLSCDGVMVQEAEFHKAQTDFPFLFLPATATAQLPQPPLRRGCSLPPQNVFPHLHTFVYRAQAEHVADTAGLATLASLFAHSPLQYFHFLSDGGERDDDWATVLYVNLSAVLTLRSYIVHCSMCVTRLQQQFVVSRALDGSEARVAAIHSAALCDETRYGSQPTATAELENSHQHWHYFTDVFRSAEACKEFWAAVGEQVRLAQEDARERQEEGEEE